jgi:transcriptional regulator with XRE-family HTH domain
MTGQALEKVRKGHGVSQLKAAELFGLSQPMLSHMETGKRNVSPEVARRAVELFGTDATALPCSTVERHTEDALATELGSLGYPGFAHLSGRLRNPAEFLFDALDRSDPDVRTTEGLPWVALQYPHLDWAWLLRELKVRNRQNRLGFVVSLAKKMGTPFKPRACCQSLGTGLAGSRGRSAGQRRHLVPRVLARISKEARPFSTVKASRTLESGHATIADGPCPLRCLSLGFHS